MSRVNQRLKVQLDELKSWSTDDSTAVMFRLDNVAFDVDEVFDYNSSKERLITGRIYPTSEIFNEGAFEIEIKFPSAYPLNPPQVRFRTPIYHPNVDENGNSSFSASSQSIFPLLSGQFHHESLCKTALWSNTTSLVDIVRTIVDRIDAPDPDYSINRGSILLFLPASLDELSPSS